MPFPAITEIVQSDLFTSESELREKFPQTSVERLLRIRAMYNWLISNPETKDKEFAKKRKDTKTMERAATSYAKFNNVNVEDEQSVPYDMIVVQPFTATQDPSVLGIKPIPNIEEKIRQLINKYRAESIDIDDIEFEEADIIPDAFQEIAENTNDNNKII